MKSFSQFMTEQRQCRKYVCVEYSEETTLKLNKWATDNGFNLGVDFKGNPLNPANFDFHTTIYFSTSRHDTSIGTIDVKPKSVDVKRMGFLGKNMEIPVLFLGTRNIKPIRDYYKDNGFKDEWPEYLPHISLSYADEDHPDVEDVELPNFEIIFDKIKIKDIPDDPI